MKQSIRKYSAFALIIAIVFLAVGIAMNQDLLIWMSMVLVLIALIGAGWRRSRR